MCGTGGGPGVVALRAWGRTTGSAAGTVSEGVERCVRGGASAGRAGAEALVDERVARCTAVRVIGGVAEALVVGPDGTAPGAAARRATLGGGAVAGVLVPGGMALRTDGWAARGVAVVGPEGVTR